MRSRGIILFWAWLACAALVWAADTYEIGAGDIVKITITGQPGMSGDFPVDGEGMLNFPLLGKVKAAGLSAPDLEKKLVTLLSDGYLKKPEVGVQVKEFNSLRVYVTGEVGKPGPYALKDDRSLLTLIGDLGGIRAEVGHEVIVIRPPETDAGEIPAAGEPTPGGLPNEVPGAEILRVNLKELLSGNPAKNIELRPGDTVYFPKAANVYVLGHVARPGPIRYQEGLTVFQALTLAGGVTDKGSQKVKPLRIVEGKPTEIKAKLTDVLMPEDTLRVPERFF